MHASGREHTAGTFYIPESADFLKRLTVILHERLPAACAPLVPRSISAGGCFIHSSLHQKTLFPNKTSEGRCFIYFLIASTPTELNSVCVFKGVFDDVLYVEAFPQLVSKQDHQAGQNSLYFSFFLFIIVT